MKVHVGATGILALAAVAAGAYVLWRGSRAAGEIAGQVAGAVSYGVQQINPMNPDNVFASSANAVTSAATGRPETFGGWLRSVTSDDDERIEAMLRGGPPPKARPAPWLTDNGRFNNPSAYIAPPVTVNGTGYDVPGLPDYFAP